jgi:CRP-like cAMP-binding protein
MSTAMARSHEGSIEAEGNHFLAGLAARDKHTVNLNLERVMLERDSILRNVGEQAKYVYFPVDSVVSEMSMRPDGLSLQVAFLGCEGLTGLSALLGGRNESGWEKVFRAGQAFRVERVRVERAYDRSPQIQTAVLRCAQALITQRKKTLLCSQRHSVHEQLCRYLLLAADRTRATHMELPQATIASALCLSAGKIAGALFRLQMAGAISYERGQLNVVDRGKLRRLCCECYGAIRHEYDLIQPRRAIA